MDLMEDGELPSSENEEEERISPQSSHNSAEISFQDDILDDSNYVIIQRPKSSLPVPSKSLVASTTVTDGGSSNKEQKQQEASQHTLVPSGYDGQQNDIFGSGGVGSGLNFGGYEQFGKKGYYKRAGVSDLLQSSDKESSSDSNDSDDDNYNGKRSRMAMPMGHQYQVPGFNNASTSAFGSASGSASSMPQSMDESCFQQQPGALDDFFAQAANFQKQRKPNLVWSNVMQEEEISKLGHQVRVGGGLAEVEVTRGPETYFFQRPMRQPRRRRASDSSDISSEGLSDNALHYLKDGIEYEDEEAEAGEPSEDALPKSFKSSSVHSRKTSKRRKTSQKHKRKIINKLKKMKSPELAEYMAAKLKEEKVKLLARSIETLGKDSCIHVFLKTLKIEKRGGIMIKTQERRRTPGGVFLYLIRGDRRFPKSLIDVIFREERANFDKVRKKKIASKRLRKKMELETAKASLEQADMTKLDDLSESESDNTAIADGEKQDQDGTDTGQLGDDSTQESSVHSRDTTTDELNGLMGMQCDGSES